MRGGGRNREIQRLQGAAAQNGGEGTARQQARMQYLQNHREAGRRPQGPQTGGPLQEAMGAGGQAIMEAMGPGGNYKDNIRMGPGGQDAIRTQQPWNGGPGMSNGGTTWDGQAPMNPYGGGKPMQPGSDAGFPGREAMDAMRRPQGGKFGADGRLKMPTAQELEQSAQENGRRMGMTPDQFNQWRETANNNGIRNGLGQSTATPPGQSWTPVGSPPMQRPTPMQNDAGFQQQLDPAQMERLKQNMNAPRTMGQNPNTIAGQGVGAGRFQTDGMRAPEARNPTGNQFMGGGDPNMNRFSKFGSFVPPARNVEGNQVRGGGSPGLSRRRVNTNPNRGAPAGVLAQPPGKIVNY